MAEIDVLHVDVLFMSMFNISQQYWC